MPTLTNTGTWTVPSDPAEATRYVFEKLKKLLSERKQLASRIRDVVQDAKAHGYTTSTVRLAFRTDSMSPKARDKWLKGATAVASLYGIPLVITEGATVKLDKELMAFVNTWRALRTEKRELNELFRDLKKAAQEQKVDYDALAYVIRLDPKEPDEREEWMERLDAMARFLGYW